MSYCRVRLGWVGLTGVLGVLGVVYHERQWRRGLSRPVSASVLLSEGAGGCLENGNISATPELRGVVDLLSSIIISLWGFYYLADRFNMTLGYNNYGILLFYDGRRPDDWRRRWHARVVVERKREPAPDITPLALPGMFRGGQPDL